MARGSHALPYCGGGGGGWYLVHGPLGGLTV